jgi:transposase-like protein
MRHTPDTKAAVITDYLKGVSLKNLQAHYEVGVTTIWRWIRASEYSLRVPRMTPADRAKLVEEFKAGTSVSELARRHGWNPKSVERALQLEGAKVRTGALKTTANAGSASPATPALHPAAPSEDSGNS